VESSSTRGRRINPGRRQTERVSPLELFFDLVFVLAITQCTQLMADNPTWEGLGQGLLVLALLWWAWVGYSWLTSVLDPDDGAIRAVIFGAMGALLIVSICVPAAFQDLALEFAIAYAAVRLAHIAVFVIASADDPDFRRATLGLGIGTAVGSSLLILGALLGGTEQAVLWSVALVLDVGEPYFFAPEGWRLAPEHFAERHGLIVIIALGESIVAIGAGAEVTLTTGIALAAVAGILLTCAMWWAYFDVVAIVAARRLAGAEVGKVQNEMARDSYSYMHFVMVAGIVLVALGLKKTIGDVDHALKPAPAFALCGGLGLYLLGHVAFRYRHIRTINVQRLLLGVALFAVVPLATEVDSLVAVGTLTAVLWAMIAFETRKYGEARRELRAKVAAGEI
jgi:low temperature requirement protein LtrA